MQNVGAVSIIAEIKNDNQVNPTGMVVFYYNHAYSSDGCIQTTPLPPASDVPQVSYAYDTNQNSDDFRVCGVTLVSTGDVNEIKFVRTTVFVSGAVLFCNTGQDPISAGDEVWVEMRAASKGADSIPCTIGRSLGEEQPEKKKYQYVGRCLVGAAPSYLAGKRLCFGQVLLGVQSV